MPPIGQAGLPGLAEKGIGPLQSFKVVD